MIFYIEIKYHQRNRVYNFRVIIAMYLSITQKSDFRARFHAFMTFGQWVRTHRRAADLTQAQLAERLGTSQGYVSAVEKDSEREISKRTARQFATALGRPEAEALAAAGSVVRSQEDVEYIVNLDELTPEGYNDYDDLPPQARRAARDAATQAAKGAFKSVADAIREVRRDSPGTVAGAGPVERES